MQIFYEITDLSLTENILKKNKNKTLSITFCLNVFGKQFNIFPRCKTKNHTFKSMLIFCLSYFIKKALQTIVKSYTHCYDYQLFCALMLLSAALWLCERAHDRIEVVCFQIYTEHRRKLLLRCRVNSQSFTNHLRANQLSM